MLLWINGAFGAGKTSVAEQLAERVPNTMLYDPEIIGTALGYMVPASPTGDYQDLPIWRNLVSDAALAIDRHYDKTLIVPMTLVRPEYQQEIFDAIKAGGCEMQVVTLVVSPEELRRRITAQVLSPDPEADEQTRQWRLDQVDRCVDALQDERLGAHVSNEGRTVTETVDQIIAGLPAALR